jgi:CHASE3 domain sensor protein
LTTVWSEADDEGMSLTIRQKLLGGFGVVLGLLVVATILSVSALGRVNNEAETLGKSEPSPSRRSARSMPR